MQFSRFILSAIAIATFSIGEGKAATWIITNEWGAGEYTFRGDFNGDGLADIASANHNLIYLKLSTGSGFTTQTWPTDNVNWGSGEYTFSGDFNGDGLTDIASAYHNQIFMKLSTGSGFTTATWTTDNVNWGGGAYSFAGDFNGDGLTDIASANGNLIYMKLSTGSGFTTQTWVTDNVNWGAGEYTFAGDFNGDGLTDIASASHSQIFMKLSTSTGFTTRTWSTDNTNWGGGAFTFSADFNGDGLDDIGSVNQNHVYMKLSTGEGFRTTTWTTDTRWGGGSYTFAGDFDGDGSADLASANVNHMYMKLSTGYGFNPYSDTSPASVNACRNTQDFMRAEGCLVITANAPHADGGYTSVSAKVYPATSNVGLSLEKIVLIVPGFDLFNSNSFASTAQWLNTGIENGEGLVDKLRANGYDVLIVDYGVNVNDYIENNGMSVVELLKRIKTLRTGPQSTVVIGASMGGLVSRYALAYMDHNNVPHSVRTYISYDTPHQGANIPLGVQYAPDFITTGMGRAKYRFEKLESYSSYAAVLSIQLVWPLFGPISDWLGPQQLTTPAAQVFGVQAVHSVFADMEGRLDTPEDARDILSTLQSPAARQMLINHYQANGSDLNRTILLDELRALGNYPTSTRNVAFTNGSAAGIGYPEIAAGIPMLNYAGQRETPFQGSSSGDRYINLQIRVEPTQPSTAVFSGHFGGPIVDWKNTLFGRVPQIRYDTYHQAVNYSGAGHRGLDGAPGSYALTIGELANAFNRSDSAIAMGMMTPNIGYHSFVPTFSALDIDLSLFGNSAYADFESIAFNNYHVSNLASLTPFDQVYFPSRYAQYHEKHLQVTPEEALQLYLEITRN